MSATRRAIHVGSGICAAAGCVYMDIYEITENIPRCGVAADRVCACMQTLSECPGLSLRDGEKQVALGVE